MFNNGIANGAFSGGVAAMFVVAARHTLSHIMTHIPEPTRLETGREAAVWIAKGIAQAPSLVTDISVAGLIVGVAMAGGAIATAGRKLKTADL
jgi:hypothetical protein